MNKFPGVNLHPYIELPMTYEIDKFGPALVHIYIKGEDTLMFYSQKAYPDPKRISKEIILKQLA